MHQNIITASFDTLRSKMKSFTRGISFPSHQRTAIKDFKFPPDEGDLMGQQRDQISIN